MNDGILGPSAVKKHVYQPDSIAVEVECVGRGSGRRVASGESIPQLPRPTPETSLGGSISIRSSEGGKKHSSDIASFETRD